MRKRLISLCLALLLCAGALLSCSGATENADETAPVQDAASSEAPVNAEEETESATPYWDAVPKTDLGGIAMNATCNYFDSNFYNVLDWEETSGDNLKDAMYTRNRFIEEQLNCQFLVVYGDAVKMLEQSVVAGSGDVDFTYSLISNGGGLIQKGYLTAFNKLETADMTQRYWDQGAQRYLKILGQMYFGELDFGFDHYDSLAVLFYNGVLLNKFRLEDPQELFLSEEWTVDKMTEQLAAVLTDENGDGKYDLKNDTLGLVGREYWFQPILFGAGEFLVTWDWEEEKFALHLGEERFIEVSETIAKIYAKDNPATNYSDYDQGRIAFSDGRALYYSRLLGDFRQLREVEDDYGVVCFPRYDFAVEDSSYFVKNPTTLFLPLVVGDDNGDGEQDFDEIGIFLQAMGAYTFDVTLNVYIENTVIGKGMRDEKSAEMVRIMMTNRSFDLCEAFGLQTFLDAYQACIVNNSRYASTAEKVSKNFNKLTQKLVDAMRKNIG